MKEFEGLDLSREETDKLVEAVGKAHNEAIDYMNLMVQNLDDREYVKMIGKRNGRNIVIAQAVRDLVVPTVADMENKLPKLLKKSGLDKRLSVVLLGVFMARLMENMKGVLDD